MKKEPNRKGAQAEQGAAPRSAGSPAPLDRAAGGDGDPEAFELLVGAEPVQAEGGGDQLVRHLEEQLRVTREQLQATSGQLESAQEAFLSANEELQSANEELQATNEELCTVNAELQHTVAELGQAGSDMDNLLSTSGIASLFLDRQLNIKGFTPALATLFNLIRSDVGRPFRHFAARLEWSSFTADAETVLAGHSCAERESSSLDRERCFLQRICPYLTPRGEIDGIVVSFIDITERKRIDDILKESEQRVRLKLESVLSPEGDLANLELEDIIDARALQSLVDDFYQLTRMPMGLLDMNGKVVVGVGWQEICTRFHRVNPESCRACLESDLKLSAGVPHGQYKIYKCKNQMWDVATPIMVGDTQFGNLFMGQFFFEDEPIDYRLFREQAEKYGFDEKQYLAALEAVPRMSRETLDTSMAFFIKLADLLSKLSYSNLKLARSLAERESAQQILRRYELLARHSRDIILFLDRGDGRILEANDAAVESYGYPHQELLQMTIQQLRAPQSQALTEVQMALADSRGILFETTHRRKDGGTFPVEVSSRGADIGGVRTLISVIRDISERRKVEDELRRAHDELEIRIRERTEELASTVDTLKDEIGERQRVEASLLRLNRLYTVLSETDHAIVRVTDRDSLFRDFCRIAVEHGGFVLAWVGLLDEESGALNRAADCGATGYLDLVRISADRDPSGSGPTGCAIRQEGYYICNDFLNAPCAAPWHEEARRFGIRASASVAIKEEGLVIGALNLYAGEKDFFDQQHVALVVQLGSDISFALDNLTREARRQRAEQALREETLGRLRALEALREKEKMLLQQNRLAAMGEMINNIAHQWRQPLNVLGLLIQQTEMFSEMENPDREALEGNLGKAMGLIKHMSQTIDDFRNFFLPDKEKAQFHLREVVDRTVALVEDGFRSQGIGIELEGEADPVVLGFPNEFCQVLLNILMNARDALVERRTGEAKVVISIRQEEERGVVTIADNAGGIAEEHLGKIFEPYFTTKGPDKGTGVGLFMSKAIIENNMGGRLSARNTGAGAEFRIEI